MEFSTMNADRRSNASEVVNRSDNSHESHSALRPDIVLIPPSAFIMGTDIEPFYGTILPQSEYAKLNEAPMHVVYLGAYRIDRYPVTNAEYENFVNATGHAAPPDWKNGMVTHGEENLPVAHVNWYDANAYAQWAGGRLPSEVEWEKAARGADGRIYPWGNHFFSHSSASDADGERNKRFGDPNTTSQQSDMAQILTDERTPVGSRPLTASPYGVHEVAGNVWEWTSDRFKPYPGNPHTDRGYGNQHKVLRGGSWLEVRDETAERYFRSANRLHAPPDYTASNIGFRCVRDVPPEEARTYPPQISVELSTKYVKQERRKNLRVVLRTARQRCIQDLFIAMALIGGCWYGIRTPRIAILGLMLGIVGVALLLSVGINFWRQWKAGRGLKSV
jgi:formylglycine-generating enzyme required for sulfatase activity